VPGEAKSCACETGAQGSQTCKSDGSYAACTCGGEILDGPEDPWPASEVDTSSLDPLPGGVGGEDNPLSCLGLPAPWFYVTQPNHQNGAIDLACTNGENLANPFPAPAQVVQLTDSFSNQNCYSDVASYNSTCHGSKPPGASAACNNKLVVQTTIAGVDWQITMLHISGSAYNVAAGRAIEVGDVVDPFAPLALCGNVGWVCPGPSNDGSHLHLVLKNLDTGQTLYPEDMFDAGCSALASGAGCTPGSTCCDASGNYVSAGSKGTACDDSCHACNGGGGCYDTCGKNCLAGDGLYCGGSVGLDPNTLFSCTAGVYTPSEPCPNGCQVAPAGEPDACKSGSNPTACPSGDGLYCGTTLGLDANKLYQCSASGTSVADTCDNGCTVAPPGQPDYCTPGGGSCPSGDGLYCGTTLGLNANTLYQCTGGTTSVAENCPNGCSVAPPGSPDYCTPGGGSCPSGNGLYCGGSVGKNPQNLYNCVNGNVTLQQACPNDCVVAPPGSPDYCI
jgi:hypothetical protein